MFLRRIKLIYWIILLGAAIKLINPLFRSLWGDESHSLFIALFFEPNIPWVTLVLSHAHLPAYFLLLAGWIKMIGSNEYFLRLLSIIIGIAAIPLIHRLAREIFDDEKTADLSALLLAVSPLAVMHSQEIRMYGLLLFLALASSLYCWRLYQGKHNRANIIGYLVFTVLLLLTHVFGALLVAAQFCLIFGWPIVAGLIALPFYWSLFSQCFSSVISPATDMAFSVFPWFLKIPLIFFVLTLGETTAPWNWLVVVPAFIAVVILLARNIKRADKFILVMLLAPVVLSGFLPPTMPKYLIISLPFFLLLLSAGAAKDRLGKVCLVILILCQSLSLLNYFSLREYHNSHQIEPWRGVAGLIRQEFKPGDIIIVTNHDSAERILDYYLNLNETENYFPIHLVKGPDAQYPGRHLIVSQLGGLFDLESLSAKRVWFVTHILDDRNFPSGYVEQCNKVVSRGRQIVLEKHYIPYEQTLVAKLPIKRHQAGSYRIGLTLYSR